MKRKIRILYVTSEISPYANAGGLGEVGRSFPLALKETGRFEVRRVMPLYKTIDKDFKYVTDYPVPMEQGFETCVVKTDPQEKEIPTYFIGNDRFFFRDNLYAYEDDGIRFFFFCKAIIEMLKKLPYQPDIVHTNDWHTGFLSLLIKKEFPGIKTVFTIHNIAYHGFVPDSYLSNMLNEVEKQQLGFPEWLNFMKAGVIYSDLLTTVSPGYAREIKHPALSCGMSKLIEQRSNSCIGIINGIDTESYDPKQQGILDYPYDINNLENKKKNRSIIRKEYGLVEAEIPLAVMITRLDYTKGIDILLKAIDHLDFERLQLIILGSGSPYYQGLLAKLASDHKGRIAVDFNYQPIKAKKLYAAADIYLMPSLTEPCGLGQLYAMRYGAVPIVNPVGGLHDTVIDDQTHPLKSNGFYMEEWSKDALVKAVERAITLYHTKDWIKLVKNGMKYDSSWSNSVSDFAKHYEDLLS